MTSLLLFLPVDADNQSGNSQVQDLVVEDQEQNPADEDQTVDFENMVWIPKNRTPSLQINLYIEQSHIQWLSDIFISRNNFSFNSSSVLEGIMLISVQFNSIPVLKIILLTVSAMKQLHFQCYKVFQYYFNTDNFTSTSEQFWSSFVLCLTSVTPLVTYC